jgi:DNA-binding protein HU-beta
VNKTELVDAVAQEADISRASAARVVDAVFGHITRHLGDGESVTISGFGTFSVRQRAARSGRNPHSGEMMAIPASRVPAFKAGKGLKDAVN